MLNIIEYSGRVLYINYSILLTFEQIYVSYEELST